MVTSPHLSRDTRGIPTLLSLTLLALLGAAGCSPEPPTPPDGGEGGGPGGSPGTGGTPGGGGSPGTGGVSSGGGSGGSGGAGGADSGGDGPIGDRPGEGGGLEEPGAFLDRCFAGVRAGVDRVQTATKSSADGTVRMRILLETAGGIGTSGTFAWKPVRFALATPDARICLTTPAALAGAYQGSRHNCNDKLVFTEGGRRYEILHPDTRPDRQTATLTVFSGATMVLGPVQLSTSSCVAATAGQPCSSGGPC